MKISINIEKLEEKIINHEGLSEDEVYFIFNEEPFEIIDDFCDPASEGRWNICEEIIFKIKDKYYSLFYQKGKTEYQEDFYSSQNAVEVIPKEIKKIEWVVIDRN